MQKAHASLQGRGGSSQRGVLDREGSSQCLAMVFCLSTRLLFFPIMSLEGGLSPVNPRPLVSWSVTRAARGDGERGHDVHCWWLDTKPQQALPLCADAIYANYFQLLLYQPPKCSKEGKAMHFERVFPAGAEVRGPEAAACSDFCCCFAVDSWVL